MAENKGFGGFKINEKYAEKYNSWRGKEELQKLKDKYGDVAEESSTSESEDDDAEALTNELEKDWLKTLAAIKTKNPQIYDPDVQFYQENQQEGGQVKSKSKAKPMFLKDYERNVILEKGGVVDEDTDNPSTSKGHGYYEEQEEILKDLKDAVVEEDDEDNSLFTAKKMGRKEVEKEEAEYTKWLKGQKADLDDKIGVELDPLKQYWTNPKLGDGEKFLRDYILDKKYLNDDDDETVPSYGQIIAEDISEDEAEIEKQELFERKFNFRFEEPDPEFIKSFPRTIGESVRRKDDVRSKKRLEDKDRKRKEKEKRMEELKQLKNLKKKEIMEKMDIIKSASGLSDVGLTENDIEEDFDPDKHDELMKNMFDDDYYMDMDDVKPDLDDEDDDMKIPGEEVMEKHLDEYYKMNFEDIIGDQPSRFKYRNVVANDFGLDVAEVLTCPDRELNAWVSVKKMSQYRTEEEEQFDRKLYEKKGKQEHVKLKSLPSLTKKKKVPTATLR